MDIISAPSTDEQIPSEQSPAAKTATKSCRLKVLAMLKAPKFYLLLLFLVIVVHLAIRM